MDLNTYLTQKRGRKAALAKALGAYIGDIGCWAKGTKAVPLKFGAPIEAATDKMVTRQELFPDIWHIHWPELVKKRK